MADRSSLAPGTVDVWVADLAAHGEPERALLSPVEHARAERFARAEDGERWARARGILRALLGRYAGEDPRALALVVGEHGKPRLDGSPLRFNVSHSAGAALYAVARAREVGVDVELPRRAVDHVAIARRAFGAAEAERIAALDGIARERAFLRSWVRWEAVLKCRGTGIGGEKAAPDGPQPWVADLAVDPPGAAALAVEGGPCAVRLRRWPAADG
ncbi:MAG TPA: 4'-phosphopantetheinyl transferase superfamily protein [Conexibacter sp.]|nr:4'-phosphopantetheinyl transferase superfamily protein [Conexibacter sp.]